jgi:hypothetical protein
LKPADRANKEASSNAFKRLRMNSRKYIALICSIQSQAREVTVWIRALRPKRERIATKDLALFLSTNNSDH